METILYKMFNVNFLKETRHYFWNQFKGFFAQASFNDSYWFKRLFQYSKIPSIYLRRKTRDALPLSLVFAYLFVSLGFPVLK